MTTEDIFYLLFTYPDLQALAQKKGTKLTANAVMEMGPEILAQIAVHGTHEKANKKALEKAKQLPGAFMAKIMAAIFRLTFPQGIGPFVEDLNEMTKSFTVTSAASLSQPIADSPSPSPSMWNAQLQMDSASEMRYRPHRAN
jgi:hypothetical protein